MNKVLRGDYGGQPNTIPKSVPKKAMPKQPVLKPVRIKQTGRGK
jgi:hypothetical protein